MIMKTIIINDKIISNYLKAKEIWDKNNDVELKIQEILDVDTIVTFLLNNKNSFSFSILSDLVEKQNISNSLLEKIFHEGDIGCKISVYYKNDLSDDLRRKVSLYTEQYLLHK